MTYVSLGMWPGSDIMATDYMDSDKEECNGPVSDTGDVACSKHLVSRMSMNGEQLIENFDILYHHNKILCSFVQQKQSFEVVVSLTKTKDKKCANEIVCKEKYYIPC